MFFPYIHTRSYLLSLHFSIALPSSFISSPIPLACLCILQLPGPCSLTRRLTPRAKCLLTARNRCRIRASWCQDMWCEPSRRFWTAAHVQHSRILYTIRRARPRHPKMKQIDSMTYYYTAPYKKCRVRMHQGPRVARTDHTYEDEDSKCIA